MLHVASRGSSYPDSSYYEKFSINNFGKYMFRREVRSSPIAQWSNPICSEIARRTWPKSIRRSLDNVVYNSLSFGKTIQCLITYEFKYREAKTVMNSSDTDHRSGRSAGPSFPSQEKIGGVGGGGRTQVSSFSQNPLSHIGKFPASKWELLRPFHVWNFLYDPNAVILFAQCNFFQVKSLRKD